MPSLNLDLNFFDHPKVKRLRASIGPEAEIYLIRIWAYAGRYHPDDGILRDFTALEIERLAEWRGEKRAMLQAMLKVGFIEKAGKWHKIHDWQEHEGHLIIFKERAKLAAASRWGNRNNKDIKRKKMPQAMLQAMLKRDSSNALAVHSITEHNRREKRGAFAPPTLEQVQAYCTERGGRVNPEQWMAHYKSNGWKVGRNPMKDWKAAIEKWEHNGFGGNNIPAEKPATITEDAPSACNPWETDPDNILKEQK